jgi:hypothetical protein
MKLVQSLENEGQQLTAAQALHQACVVLFAHVFGVMVDAPGRVIPMMLNKLKDRITLAAHLTLSECHALLVKQVSSKQYW